MSYERQRESETRRTVLKYLAAAAGVGAVAGTTGKDPFASPVAALPDHTGDGDWETDDVEIASFDDTEIAATAYEPEAEGPHPAILMTHGWGGSREDLVQLAEAYASREFFVLAYDSRGFGESQGEVNSTSEIEQQDASALIDWLADQDAVETVEEGNPVIGMDGTSYGGGIQFRTASHDDRLDSIVPRATWNNLAQGLAPNGVVKTGWLEALELGAEQEPAGNLSEAVDNISTEILDQGEMSPENREFYRSRSPVTYPDIEDTPALIIQEWTDQLFPANDGINNFEKVRPNSESTLVLSQDGTHILGFEEEFPPGADFSGAFTFQLAIQWHTAHLKGDGEHGLAPFHYFDESNEEFEEAADFPPLPEESTVFALGETVELDGDDGNVETLSVEFEEATEIAGVPRVTLDATPTGEGRSHLFVAVQRVTDEESYTIKEQVTPVAVGDAGEIELDLFAIQERFEPGDELQIAMSAREDELTRAEVSEFFGESLYLPSDEDAGIEIDSESVELAVPASDPLPEVDPEDENGDQDGDDADDTDDADDMDDTDDTDDMDDDGDVDDDADDDTDDADDDGPGFGIPAAIGGAGGLAYLFSKRRNSEATEPSVDAEIEADD